MTKTIFNAKPDTQEFTMERVFDAPRDMVFKVYTDPELIPRWWGEGGATVIDKLDPRSGGEWRFVEKAENGEEYAFHGSFHDVTGPERIVQTFEFEGMPGHVLLETITFEEEDGKTRMKSLSVFQSVEDRDGMIASGMEKGAESGLNKIDNLLEELKKA